MENYLRKFRSMVQELKEKPQIEIVKYNVNSPIEESEIIEIEKKYNISLIGNIKELYRQANGLWLEWTLNQTESEENNCKDISGSIHVLQLDQVFGGWDGKEWHDDLWFDWMDKEEKKRMKRLKPIDYFDNDDSGCVCFIVENGNFHQNLVLHSVDYGINKMGINFKTYLEMLLKTRGLFRWQYMISSKKNLYNYDAFYRSFHKCMPQIFPKTDFSNFK